MVLPHRQAVPSSQHKTHKFSPLEGCHQHVMLKLYTFLHYVTLQVKEQKKYSLLRRVAQRIFTFFIGLEYISTPFNLITLSFKVAEDETDFQKDSLTKVGFCSHEAIYLFLSPVCTLL